MPPSEPAHASASVRAAAAVILVRERSAASGTVEVLLIQRTHATSFMSSAYVFPGGAADPQDADLRETAARELFEEAGVLISRRAVDATTRTAWRAHLHDREPMPSEMRAALGAALDVQALHYYAHWITPSTVAKRFSATFYVAALADGQEPEIDNREAINAVWVTPEEGLARARELRLHPPQLRTLLDLGEDARTGLAGVFAAAERRAQSAHPILPRSALVGGGAALLLPWDPEYMSAGQGEALPLPGSHPLAVGPSRFVLEDKTWKHIVAPGSPSAE